MEPPDPADGVAREAALSRPRQILAHRSSWFRTIQVRLAGPFIVLSAVLLLVLYAMVGHSVERVYVQRLSEELVNEAHLAALSISQVYENGGSSGELADLVNMLGRLSDTHVILIGQNGEAVADSRVDAATVENLNMRPEVVEARRSTSIDGAGVSARDDEPFLYTAVLVPDSNGQVVRLAVPLDGVGEAVAATRRPVLVAAASVVVLSIVAAWITAGQFARPLRSLRDQAKDVARGDVSSRVKRTGTVEIDAVGDAFNMISADLERSLQAQEQASIRLEAVMEGLADGVVLTDEEGVVLRINRAAERLLEIDEDSGQGQPFLQVARDHEMAQVLRSALDGKKNPNSTVVYGLERLVILVSARMVTSAPERLGLVVLRDITELKRLEMVRREFVANVSHELRTPLTSIRALVETLEGGVVEEEAMARDFLGRIVGEVDRLNALVEDLLDFARLEAGRSPLQLERIDIGEAVRAGAERLRPQIEQAQLSLQVNIEDGLPEIQIDVKRMEQVILNLVHNAIKFTPAGGQIAISVWRQKGEIAVQVRDTGVGIAEEDLGRLFERFYKSDRARHSEGTGLGLAIAKHIVQLHGGEIAVTSAPEEGAAFTFTLPIRRKKARKRARRHAVGLA